MDRAWKAVELKWKNWQDGVVVFNLLSGNTHVLNPTAARVLNVLNNAPMSGEELASKLASDNGIDFDKDLVERVQGLLANLDDLGLIEPAA